MGKCHFQVAWLEKQDAVGNSIKTWAQKFDEDNAFCIVCSKKLQVGKGFQALYQHAKGDKHKQQLKLTNDGNNNNKIQTIRLWSSKESAVKAEILWTLRSVVHNYSMNSTEGIKDTFAAMFPDSDGINEHFTLSPAKMSYIISDALGPHFKIILLEDVQGAYFSLCYDETTNKGGHKELQIKALYWSNRDKHINSHHLYTSFIGRATAEDIVKQINRALDHANLSRNKMIMLGSDGPNVNKTVFRLMNEDILKIRNKCLINVGTCNLHLVHNAFLKGLDTFGSSCADLLVGIKYFFKDRPARWEDYQKSQERMKVPPHNFIKHVSSRWLSLGPAAERLIEQWPAVIYYFKTFIPTKKSDILKTNTYKSIINILKMQSLKIEVLFVISSAKLFESFSLTFQKSEPQVHILHSELLKLIKTLIMRFCHENAAKLLQSTVDVEQIFNIDTYLPVNKIIVGENVALEISKIKNEREKLEIYQNIRNHYKNACIHLLNKSPLALESGNLLKYLRSLHPNRIKLQTSANEILNILKMLPLEIKAEQISDEWNLLKLDELPNYDNKLRVDVYWNQIFERRTDAGEQKYQHISVLIKAALAISHGNSDVERGFSKSGKILTKDRSLLGERMLNNLLYISDGMVRYGNKPELVPITKALITQTELARSNYHTYLEIKKKEEEEKLRLNEEEKKIKEDQEKKLHDIQKERESIENSEKKLKEQLEEENYQKQTSRRLLEEANAKLARSLKNKDLVEANVAQAMIEAVKKRMEEESIIEIQNKKHQKRIIKRKNELLTNYVSKKIK